MEAALTGFTDITYLCELTHCVLICERFFVSKSAVSNKDNKDKDSVASPQAA
jgi:hypothetical protein